MDTDKRFIQASIKTGENLKTIAQHLDLRELSQLSLPEIDAAVNLVSQIIPAGNVPGVILSGLARLPGRKPPAQNIRRDINLIFKGVEQALDKAVYGAFFAGPAAVIWGYQNLLKLAGKNPDDAFPEGTWQFYVDYALREDSARHANETHGFDTTLNEHQIRLPLLDRITAWAMAAIHSLHYYPDLLANEWRERTYTFLLKEATSQLPDAAQYARLYSQWEKQRPYARGQDATGVENYPRYRESKFRHFLKTATETLPPAVQAAWQARIQTAEEEELPAYIRQMALAVYLEPTQHGEVRTPLEAHEMHIGLIYRGHYYLLPVYTTTTANPADVQTIRRLVATLLHHPVETPPTQLTEMARIKRTALADLRPKLSVAADLNALRKAPIWLNFDQRPRNLHLAQIRQAERGIGDHGLTIFDTGETFVFDQSHILFDGAWGAALAEIMTSEALAWAVYLMNLPPAEPDKTRPTSPALQFDDKDLALIKNAPRVMPETSAESEAVKIKSMLSLRQVFKQRSDLLQLTVNDLLILYRAIHAMTYRVSPELEAALNALTFPTARSILESIETQFNPAILIPVDASLRSPRERLYPMSFEVPLADLDLLHLHHQVIQALNAYENIAGGNRVAEYQRFDTLQRTYLATLAGFGTVLSRAKEIANAGESTSVGTIKLLAHMPTPLQRLLDHIPGRFEILNDIIKGREVFSNVGAVVTSSTLTRFISAKDDNEKKTLVWGAITDAKGVMRLSLRDFRPHVKLLVETGYSYLAQQIAQEYLDTYVLGLNNYVYDVRRITLASRETRLAKGEIV